MSEVIYNRIAMLRAERGISRRQLADALGVHYQTVGYLERGEFRPEPAPGAADRRVLRGAGRGRLLARAVPPAGRERRRQRPPIGLSQRARPYSSLMVLAIRATWAGRAVEGHRAAAATGPRRRVIALARANSRSPSSPWMRPKPESPTPPNGSVGHADEGERRVDRGHAGAQPPGDRRSRAPCRRPSRPGRTATALASCTASSASRTLVMVTRRPERLLADGGRVLRHVDQDGRRDVRRLHRVGAAEHRPAAAGERVVDVPADDVDLAGHGDRADVGALAGAHRQPTGALDHRGDERVVDRRRPRTPARCRRRSARRWSSRPRRTPRRRRRGRRRRRRSSRPCRRPRSAPGSASPRRRP